MRADEIPVAHTPPGGYGATMPPPILDAHPVLGHVQRVEQCGDRLVVTGGGVVHDMRCDGTEEHGVHDVAEFDYTTPITVVASYGGGVHVLRPVGLPIEVRRWREGDDMLWQYVGFTARLERVR